MGLLAWAAPALLHAEPLQVVATTPLLADLARQVGGDDVTVTTLIPVGTDPHGFEPTPQDLKAVSGAGVVLASGKGMEGYMAKLRNATGQRAILLEVGDQVPGLNKPAEKAADDDDHAGHDHAAHDHAGHDHGHDHHGHDHIGGDPHWWQSVQRVSQAAAAIGKAFSQADPEHAADYAKRATALQGELYDLERWARVQWAAVPRDQRRIATAHDAFGYYAEDWGLTIIPVAGLSTQDAPSARRVAEIVERLKKGEVVALFIEDTTNPQLVEQISRESGVRVGGKLWAAGPPEAGQGYADFFRHNTTVLVEALKPAQP